MNTPTWIRETLDERGVAYRECHHPCVYTAQQVAHQEHISGRRVAKVVVVMADGQPIELVLPASRQVLLERIRELLGARTVRLATEPEMAERFKGCEVGAIPPLGHWSDVPILMDESLRGPGPILFQAGTHCDAIRMTFDDWFVLTHPRVENFTSAATVPDNPSRRRNVN